jgi:hypothetical protein
MYNSNLQHIYRTRSHTSKINPFSVNQWTYLGYICCLLGVSQGHT